MKDKKTKTKRLINYIILSVTLSIIIWLGVEEYKDMQIEQEEISEKSQYHTQNVSTLYQSGNEKETNKQDRKEQIIEEYNGYDVEAKLEIPAIELETYILKNYSLNALNTSVTKFWGADANEIGNFCVAGHNFQNKNMFRNLRKLEKGNRLFISDNTNGKIEYEIYNIYKVEPEDVSCLSQETNGKREVTLITCTTDSEKRIIVKAKEIE